MAIALILSAVLCWSRIQWAEIFYAFYDYTATEGSYILCPSENSFAIFSSIVFGAMSRKTPSLNPSHPICSIAATWGGALLKSPGFWPPPENRSA